MLAVFWWMKKMFFSHTMCITFHSWKKLPQIKFSIEKIVIIHRILISGSLESPLSASSSTQAYHPSSTYFHHECQWFFDPPPAKQLILKISTAQKMSKYMQHRISRKISFFKSGSCFIQKTQKPTKYRSLCGFGV